MTGEHPQGNELFKLIEAWMETTKSFWLEQSAVTQAGGRGDTEEPFRSSSASGETDEQKFKTYKAWQTSINNCGTLLKLMTAPENQDVMLRSGGHLAEAVVQAAGDSFENFTEFQDQWLKGFAKVNEHTKAFNFDDLNHETFESFRELYRSELQKYFHIPKVGLPREFHEQLSQLMDRSNIFHSHLIELLYLFFIPFEKTNQAIQEKTKQMLERGEFTDDFKQGYNDWIKTLEAHYSDLLRSKEYTHVLNNTINSLAEYKNAKNEVIGIYVKDLQIPTNKEMDEIYKDIYQMKKTIKELTRTVESLRQQQKDRVEQRAATGATGEVCV